MSNIYIQEPPTSGKVVLKTTVGDIDLELWTKEAPKACRNFIQLCMEGYYDDTIFHRIVKGFIVQGGDPTGTGESGESIYGSPFKDEFHTRLRFCRRGLLAMANSGKDDNGSQFFFTLGPTPELQNKHTIFGKVTGETIFNMLKLGEAVVNENDRPLYPQKILRAEILNNPFEDIVARTICAENQTPEENKGTKAGVKNFKLLSFGEEAEEDEEESVIMNKQFSGRGKSAHDNLSDPKLSTTPVAEPAGPPTRKIKEDRSNDWEDSDDERSAEGLAALWKEKEKIELKIENKFKDAKNIDAVKKSKIMINRGEDEEIDGNQESEEEYHLGMERVTEREEKMETIRREIRHLKREVKSNRKVENAQKDQKLREGEDKFRKTAVMSDYIRIKKQYKEATARIPKKGTTREDFTMQLLNKFKSKLQNAKESFKKLNNASTSATKEETYKQDLDADDKSWLVHAFHCEDSTPVVAKDASTKDDDWFEIYDPRNPLNKRRRGEKTKKTDGDNNTSHWSHFRHKNTL